MFAISFAIAFARRGVGRLGGGTYTYLRLELEEPLLSSLALGLAGLGLLPHPRQFSAHLVSSVVARRARRAHPLLLKLQEALVVAGVPGRFFVFFVVFLSIVTSSVMA